jgi:LPXTG-motif cell wall-anchored protein
LTDAAEGQQTATATGLPDTGFADDVGIPGLLGLALVLIVVVFLARRFRMAGG